MLSIVRGGKRFRDGFIAYDINSGVVRIGEGGYGIRVGDVRLENYATTELSGARRVEL